MTENYRYYPKQYQFVIGITWDHVDQQISYEKEAETYSKISDTTDLVIHCGVVPGLLQNIKMKFVGHGYRDMHIYSSRHKEAVTMGRHNDDQDVLIVQSLGKMMYVFDDGDSVTLNPGDGLYIPKFVYHNPVHVEPRITVSLS